MSGLSRHDDGPSAASRAEASVAALRYSVVRVGDADFAFSDHDVFVAALGHVWDAGLVPEPRPSVTHPELRFLPKLRGVDVDLGELTRADVQREHRFR
jgi:hypothetical protein